LKSQNQEDSDSSKTKIKLDINADLVSRFIWRGNDYGNSPAIQPYLNLVTGNFELGCWGSVATNSSYTEIDIIAKYTYKKYSLAITDYFVPETAESSYLINNNFFNFKDKTTVHTFEVALAYKGDEKLPLSLMTAVYIYGNDKRWGYDLDKDNKEKTYYSSYFEASYGFKIQENTLDIFAGFTPFAGAYGHKAGIVNLGITANRKIKISDHFEIPLKANLIFNPLASTAYFVLGITL
jgi:hypothetical protein